MPENAPLYPRTAAFSVKAERQAQKYHFWTIDPAPEWEGPGFYIREHQVETFSRGSMSKRVTEKLTERDAFLQLAELERAAAEKYPLTDDKVPPASERLGDNYFKSAKPFRECFNASVREDALALLRSRRAKSGLKLKP